MLQGHQDFQKMDLDAVVRVWCLERAMLFSRDPAEVLPAAQLYYDFLQGREVDTTNYFDEQEDVVGTDINIKEPIIHAPVGIQLGKGLDLAKAESEIDREIGLKEPYETGSRGNVPPIVQVMADAEVEHDKVPANVPAPAVPETSNEITPKQRECYVLTLSICKEHGPLNGGQIARYMGSKPQQIIGFLKALVRKKYLVNIPGPVHIGQPTTLFYPVELGEPALEKKSVAGK